MALRDWVYPAILLGLVLAAAYARRGSGGSGAEKCYRECIGMGYPSWLCRQMCERYSAPPR